MGSAIDLLNGWKFYPKAIINGANTKKYSKLEKGKRQDDPISTYLFILVLEIVFLSIKENKNIKGLNIFNHTFLQAAYVDNTAFFSKRWRIFKRDYESLWHILIFLWFETKKKTKCEVAGIGALKGTKMALCGMTCIELRSNTVKILGIRFSYNKKIGKDKNYLKAHY